MPELLVLARTMRLYTMDAWVSDPDVLTDEPRLRAALRAGARAGGATVLDETFCVFSNGAVTGVLVLAQSHLSLHTWPELSLANVDLLSYGDVRARRCSERSENAWRRACRRDLRPPRRWLSRSSTRSRARSAWPRALAASRPCLLRSRASSRSRCARSAARWTSPSRSSRLSAGSCVDAATSRRLVPCSSRSKDDDDSRRRRGVETSCPGCGGRGVALSQAVARLRRGLASLAERPRAARRARPVPLHAEDQVAPRAGDARRRCDRRAPDPAARRRRSHVGRAPPLRPPVRRAHRGAGGPGHRRPAARVHRRRARRAPFPIQRLRGTSAGRCRRRSPAASTRSSPTRRTRWTGAALPGARGRVSGRREARASSSRSARGGPACSSRRSRRSWRSGSRFAR